MTKEEIKIILKNNEDHHLEQVLLSGVSKLKDLQGNIENLLSIIYHKDREIEVTKGNGIMKMICTGKSCFGRNVGYVGAISKKNRKGHSIYYKDVTKLGKRKL